MWLDNVEEWSASVESLKRATVKLPPGHRAEELDQERANREWARDQVDAYRNAGADSF